MTTTTAARTTRGTTEWQAAHLDAQRAVNTRAQVGLDLDLGVELALDTTGRDAGEQLDMFAL